MNSQLLQTPIDYLKGVGPNRADLLKKELGIHTFQDLINLFPNRYLDRTRYYKIDQLQRNSSEMQIVGKITHIKTVAQKRNKRFSVCSLVGNFKFEQCFWNWLPLRVLEHQPGTVFQASTGVKI